MLTSIQPLCPSIVRVSHTAQAAPAPSLLVSDSFRVDPHAAPFARQLADGRIVFEREGEAFLCEDAFALREKSLFRTLVEGEPLVR